MRVAGNGPALSRAVEIANLARRAPFKELASAHRFIDLHGRRLHYAFNESTLI